MMGLLFCGKMKVKMFQSIFSIGAESEFAQTIKAPSWDPLAIELKLSEIAKDFFDEFDAIAKSRLDSQEHGEIRRSVSNLLNFIENAPKNILVIVATNHPSVLDIAVWRRFDEIVEFSLPKQKEIRKLLKLKLKNYRYEINDFQEFIKKLNNLSHADIERICHDAIKFAILNKIDIINQSLLLKKSEDFLKKKAKLNIVLSKQDEK